MPRHPSDAGGSPMLPTTLRFGFTVVNPGAFGARSNGGGATIPAAVVGPTLVRTGSPRPHFPGVGVSAMLLDL
jgi:hypothetical protein